VIIVDDLGMQLGSKTFKFFLKVWLEEAAITALNDSEILFLNRSAELDLSSFPIHWPESSSRYYFTDLLKLSNHLDPGDLYFSTFLSPLRSIPSFCLIPFSGTKSKDFYTKNKIKDEYSRKFETRSNDFMTLIETELCVNYNPIDLNQRPNFDELPTVLNNFIFCSFSFFGNNLNSMDLDRIHALDISSFFKKDLIFDDGVVVRRNFFKHETFQISPDIWRTISILDLLKKCDLALVLDNNYDLPLISLLINKLGVQFLMFDKFDLSQRSYTKNLSIFPESLQSSNQNIKFFNKSFLSNLINKKVAKFAIDNCERYENLSAVEF
jgi:hypothetical protein